MVQTIGILGLGRFGLALAGRAVSAGYEVLAATTRAPTDVADLLRQAGIAAQAAPTAVVVSRSDLVVLAIPLPNYRSLLPQDFDGKLVIDPMNRWETRGGQPTDFRNISSSFEEVQAHLSSSQVVRTLNHISHKDLAHSQRSRNQSERRALAIAGNDREARRVVAEVIDHLGYEPVEVGLLAEGRKFDVGTELFSRSFSRKELVELLR